MSDHRVRATQAGHGVQATQAWHGVQATQAGHGVQGGHGVQATLVRPRRLSLATFCRATGLHPELVGRLVRLGLLDATPDAGGRPVFAPDQVERALRIRRLRSGLSLNYAALGLVLDLLDRIDELEKETWTSTD